jgi:hypothetical protein
MENERDKLKGKPNYIVMLAALVTITFLVVVTVLVLNNRNSQEKAHPWNDYLDELLKSYPDCKGKDMGLRTANPEKYGYLPRKMFCQLPPLNQRFENFMSIFKTGKVADIQSYDESFWAQPEMMTSFDSQVLAVLQNPDSRRFGVTLPAVVPADAEAEVYPGSNFVMYTTVRSSPLGLFYLGLKPVVTFPDKYESNEQQVKNASEYVHVSFTPEQYTLAPSWPVYIYNKTGGESYVKLVGMNVSVAENAPLGTYIIGMEFGQPDREYSLSELHEHLNMYTSSMFGGISRPWYVLILRVVPVAG